MKTEKDQRAASRSPLRDSLEQSLRSKYLNNEDFNNRQVDEPAMRIRDLEGFKI
jgi:hypothetical protein